MLVVSLLAYDKTADGEPLGVSPNSLRNMKSKTRLTLKSYLLNVSLELITYSLNILHSHKADKHSKTLCRSMASMI